MLISDVYNKIVASDKYTPRPTQLNMVDFINKCFSSIDGEDKTNGGENICVIEAPTGTGKSLAYILPGIINALNSELKFVISTATKVLQAQSVNVDLPLIKQKSGLNFVFGLAKGRSNYLCPYQLELNLMSLNQDLLEQSGEVVKKLTEIREHFDKGVWSGDLDASPIAINSKVKQFCTADKYQCINTSCEYNQKDNCRCPYYLNRDYLRKCDVIVTNHSLLLVDVDNGGGAVLPVAPESYFLCIDEAHNLSGYAIGSFMGSFELKQCLNLLSNLVKLIQIPQSQGYLIKDVDLCQNAINHANELHEELVKFNQILQINDNVFKDNIFILNDYLNSLVNSEVKDIFINMSLSSAELYDKLDKIHTKLKEMDKSTDIVNDSNIVKLAFFIANVEQIKQTSSYLVNNDSSKFNANVRFVERKLVSGNFEYHITAGVTHVGNHLKSKLWDRVYGACLTSATLTVGDSFEYLKSQLGLNIFTGIQTLKLESLFDYQLQGQLVIPQFKHSPDFASRDMFQKELGAYLSSILGYNENYGTLVLFFNRQQLIDTFKLFQPKLQNKILLQTEYASNHKLIEQHKKIIESGGSSIIFGLNSFAEGVDLPNKYCMHVVITKLPFDTHKDPQNLVREYWVKAENGNYFMDISLPEVCIKLIQAVGRLIRSEDDYGQVTICDNRIVLKQYGKVLLKSLPNFNREYNPNFMTEHVVRYEK